MLGYRCCTTFRLDIYLKKELKRKDNDCPAPLRTHGYTWIRALILPRTAFQVSVLNIAIRNCATPAYDRPTRPRVGKIVDRRGSRSGWLISDDFGGHIWSRIFCRSLGNKNCEQCLDVDRALGQCEKSGHKGGRGSAPEQRLGTHERLPVVGLS